MSFFAAASLGLQLLGGSSARSQAKIDLMLGKAQADADNIIRKGRNEEAAARASFDGLISSLNNNRALKAAGKASAAARINAGRIQEAVTSGSIESQIANAEAAGAYAAGVAMAGAGGSSVDAIGSALRMKQARQDARMKRQGRQQIDETLARAAEIMPDAIAGLDINTYSAGVDYGQTFAPIKRNTGNALLDIAKWGFGNPTAAGDLASNIGKFFKG